MQVIELPLPPTRNQSIDVARKNRYAAAELKKKWDLKISQNCKVVLEPMKPPIWAIVVFYYVNPLHDHDNLDGSRKYIFDGLVKAEIIPNDSLKTIKDCTFLRYIKSDKDYCKLYLFDKFPEFVEMVQWNLEQISKQYE